MKLKVMAIKGICILVKKRGRQRWELEVRLLEITSETFADGVWWAWSHLPSSIWCSNSRQQPALLSHRVCDQIVPRWHSPFGQRSHTPTQAQLRRTGKSQITQARLIFYLYILGLVECCIKCGVSWVFMKNCDFFTGLMMVVPHHTPNRWVHETFSLPGDFSLKQTISPETAVLWVLGSWRLSSFR